MDALGQLVVDGGAVRLDGEGVGAVQEVLLVVRLRLRAAGRDGDQDPATGGRVRGRAAAEEGGEAEERERVWAAHGRSELPPGATGVKHGG